MTLQDHLSLIKSGSPASERLIALLGGDDYLIAVGNAIVKTMGIAGRKRLSPSVVRDVCKLPESTAKAKVDNLVLAGAMSEAERCTVLSRPSAMN